MITIIKCGKRTISGKSGLSGNRFFLCTRHQKPRAVLIVNIKNTHTHEQNPHTSIYM